MWFIGHSRNLLHVFHEHTVFASSTAAIWQCKIQLLQFPPDPALAKTIPFELEVHFCILHVHLEQIQDGNESVIANFWLRILQQGLSSTQHLGVMSGTQGDTHLGRGIVRFCFGIIFLRAGATLGGGLCLFLRVLPLVLALSRPFPSPSSFPLQQPLGSVLGFNFFQEVPIHALAGHINKNLEIKLNDLVTGQVSRKISWAKDLLQSEFDCRRIRRKGWEKDLLVEIIT